MKLLVFSDSHGHLSEMERAVGAESPDMIYHLGDHVSDAHKLQSRTDVPVFCVRGNCDAGADEPECRLLTPGGYRIFLMHGHVYQVKYGLERALYAAQEQGAFAFLFGHTHAPLYTRHAGMHVLNPGSVAGAHTPRKTYGVITLSENDFHVEIRDVP